MMGFVRSLFRGLEESKRAVWEGKIKVPRIASCMALRPNVLEMDDRDCQDMKI